ncbi:MAG: S8 family peptidase [Deltaproteobacteria bacterium]
MPTRYLVLRANEPVLESFQLTSPSAWSKATPGPSELTIEMVDGHERDVGALRQDPRNAVVMDAEISLALIAPQSKTSADVTTLKQVGSVKMPEGIMAVGAHTTPFTGQGVTVAVLDTGIDGKHPVFQGRTVVGKDLTGEGSNENDVRDQDGHGTHCAATVCGAPFGGVRVGVAPGVVKLCIGKVLGKNGGTLEMLLKGMCWAVLDQKASVVSMSLGYDLAGNTKRLIAKGVDPALAVGAAMRQQSHLIKGISTLRTFLESQSPNVVFVAATGNESRRPAFVLDASLPAAELFSVGAVGSSGDKWSIASFSNGRAQVVAPGVDVVSAAVGGGWAIMSGTSMATPHVAGVAALWTEKLRNEGALNVPEAVRSAMKAHATRQPLLTIDADAIGVGMIQAPQS